MPVGRKLYHEKTTGDVVLEIPEKHHANATDTTKEQDFEMYDVLSARNPEQVGVIKVPYGEKREDFRKAKSVKVDIESGGLLFEFPKREIAHSDQIADLQKEDTNIGQELVAKDLALLQAQTDRDSLGEQVVGLDLRLLQGGL